MLIQLDRGSQHVPGLSSNNNNRILKVEQLMKAIHI